MASSMRYGLLVKEKEEIVPLKSVEVSAQLKGSLVGLSSTLRYRNESTDPLEVLFRFPVDESWAVVGLEAVINGRKIRAEVREKEEAKVMYDDALASGLTAALGEEKSGDIFSLALGNLPPQSEAELHLKMVAEMPLEAGSEAVRFSLPSVLKPLYTPTGSTDPLQPVAGEGDQVKHGQAPAVNQFLLGVKEKVRVASVTSPTHELEVKEREEDLEVTLRGAGPLDKDLVVLVSYKEAHQPWAMVEPGQDVGNPLMRSTALMVDFFPKFEAGQAACEFIFVIDRSGSMHGAYIGSARDTLILFLKSIPPGCYFNIIGFGSSYEHLFPESVPYNQTNLDRAVQHAQQMDANLGGTELMSPLEFIFKQKLLLGLPRQVMVLTDGSVSNTQACINLVKKNVSSSRVFTFGIGSGASTALVNGLARAGNGSAEFVKEGERMQPKVIRSLKKSLQPAVTDLKVEFQLPRGLIAQQAPNKIPALFSGEKTVLYAVLRSEEMVEGEGVAILRGRVLGKPLEHRVEFSVGVAGGVSPFPIPVVHHLAAKSLLKELAEEEEEGKGKKKEIISLSVESSVVTAHTAYIAIDEEQQKPIEGALKTWDLSASLATPMYALAAPGFGGGGRGGGGFRSKVVMQSSAGVSARKIKMRKSYALVGAAPPPPSAPVPLACMGAPPPPPMNMSPVRLSSSSSSSHFSSSLSQLITLQQAEGYWKLDPALAALLSSSLADLQGKCPVECSPAVELLWATVLALSLMEEKFLGQRDEWELVAMKAEMWLHSQPLPPATPSLDTFKQTAKSCVSK